MTPQQQRALDAARDALGRYRDGEVPPEISPGQEQAYWEGVFYAAGRMLTEAFGPSRAGPSASGSSDEGGQA